MRRKVYLTEEERRMAHNEANKRYRETHKEEIKSYYNSRKEINKQYNKQYREEHKEEIAKYCSQYREEHKEEIAKYCSQYREEHKEEKKQYDKEYWKKHYNTPIGRAKHLLRTHNRADERMGRGKGDLTAEWIVENIFSKPCAHCGETDWHKIGCNRLDNSKPHTMDNVEPCCFPCNVKLAGAEKKRNN